MGMDAPTAADDITATGSNYPICALTWDMLYPNSSTSFYANGGPAIAGLTADQNRTLYGFFTYVLSPVAQERLAAQGYDPLPTTWLDTLRQGFQADF
jgi:hypothetical protein